MATSTKLIYRPVGLLLGVAAGAVAGALSKRIWKVASGSEDVPKATAQNHRAVEIVLAAALQGAIYGAVKALVEHGGARGFERLTGTWPD